MHYYGHALEQHSSQPYGLLSYHSSHCTSGDSISGQAKALDLQKDSLNIAIKPSKHTTTTTTTTPHLQQTIQKVAYLDMTSSE